jgi:glycosyltransferase involved in cell wall biosynthesis
LHIVDSLEIGGAQKLEVTFAAEAANRGLDFTVVSLSDDDREPIAEELRTRGAEVVCVPRPGGTPVRQLLLLLALLRLLLRRRPDVVQTHLTYANVLGALAGRCLRVPVVGTLHNTDVDTAHHRPVLLRLEAWALRVLASQVVAVGPAVAAGQQARLRGVTPVVVPNAVTAPGPSDHDDRSAVRSQLLERSDQVLILSVGRLTAQKAYHDLLQAFERVTGDHPEAVLAVAGDGELRKELEEQARSSGLGERVRFLGARDDIARLLSAADMFVSSSRWEGMPLAVLEAMAAGLPVVATAVGDVPTAVVPGVGLTVSPGRPDEMAMAIEQLLDEPDLRKSYGEAAAARIRAEYGPARWVDRLLAAYDAARGHSGEGIRVAVLIHGYFPRVGGAERQMGALAPLLQTRGIDVRIVTRRFDRLAKREHVDGIPVSRVPAPGPAAIASVSYTLTALLALRRIKPTLVHAHEFISPATTALLAKRLLRVPVVVTPHRSGPLGDVVSLERRRSGPRRLAALREQTDRFLVISRDIDLELAALGVPDDRRTRMPNGVDTERFRPADRAEKHHLRAQLQLPDGPTAIFAGRLAPEKRVGHLIAIWDEVRAAVPDATLVVLGGGPEEAALIGAAGPGVLFPGAVEDVAPWYRAADVFVLPSVAEGLSVAMLEAMAAGLAAVVTDVGGASDVITSEEEGLIVPSDDVPALRGAMVAVLGDEALRHRLGERGRARVERRYALPRIADELASVYREVAARG